MKGPLVVEMVGLPGAGKTTLTERLAETLKEEGLRCVTRPEHQSLVCDVHASRPPLRRWAHFLGHNLAAPRVPLRAAMLAARMRPPSAQGWYRAYCLTRHLHNDAIAHARLDDVDLWLLDQDLLQEVWGILYFRRCTHEESLRRLLEAMRGALPDVIVHVQVDGATSLARVAGRRARLGPLGDLDRMTVTAEEVDQIGEEAARVARLAARVGGAQLIEVDGHTSTDTLVDDLRGALLGTLRGPLREKNE